MKKIFLLAATIVAICCLFSSCESYDAGTLRKSDILGVWYKDSNTRYEFNRDGSYYHYGKTELFKKSSGTFEIDRQARTWVKHQNDGKSYVYTILLLGDTTFAFEDKDGNLYIWTRDK